MSEWSDWIEHDGKGCPAHVKGAWGILCGDGPDGTTRYREGIIHGGASWDWSRSGHWDAKGWLIAVKRYRLRKPKGLLILEGILENLPVREDA